MIVWLFFDLLSLARLHILAAIVFVRSLSGTVLKLEILGLVVMLFFAVVRFDRAYFLKIHCLSSVGVVMC